jgi:HEAT repeat protein
MRFPQLRSSSTVEETPQVLAKIRRYAGANVRKKAAIHWLLGQLAQTSDGHVRNQAALALGALRIQEAVPVIVHLLSADATVNNRGSLLFALLSLNYRAYLSAIAPHLGSEGYEVMEMALQLLEQLPRRLKPRQTREAIRLLEQVVLTPLNTPYVQQGLQLLKEVTHPKKQ